MAHILLLGHMQDSDLLSPSDALMVCPSAPAVWEAGWWTSAQRSLHGAPEACGVPFLCLQEAQEQGLHKLPQLQGGVLLGAPLLVLLFFHLQV